MIKLISKFHKLQKMLAKSYSAKHFGAASSIEFKSRFVLTPNWSEIF